MPKVLASGRFNDKDVRRINYCQIYLNVTTIADVTLASSKQLDPHMCKGGRFLYSSVATHMRIHQQKPGPVSWGVWCKAMALWAKEYNLKIISTSIIRTYFCNILGTKRKEYSTLNETTGGRQQTQQSLYK
eukprot:2632452-Ditylum_brightwellii.AAC.1